MHKLLALAVLFSSTAALADFKRLYAKEAKASSFLKSNWNKYNENYHPNYILDDDPKTAWVEGVDGLGEGQTVSFEVSRIKSARAVKLRIRNGYHKRKDLLRANAAPKSLKVEVLDADGRVVAERVWAVKKKMGWQELKLKLAGKGLSAVRLTVKATIAGKKYADTCLSDVQVLVDSDVKYDKAFEEKKRDALRAWIKARRDQAAYFASLPKKYPFAGTHFKEGKEREHYASFHDLQADGAGADLDPDERKKTMFKRAEKYCGPFVAALAQSDGWAKREVERKDPPARMPDGLYEAYADPRRLTLDALTLVEAARGRKDAERVKWRDPERRLVGWIVEDGGEVDEGREGFAYGATRTLLEYDEQGRLIRSVRVVETNFFGANIEDLPEILKTTARIKELEARVTEEDYLEDTPLFQELLSLREEDWTDGETSVDFGCSKLRWDSKGRVDRIEYCTQYACYTFSAS
jgi:hypothetical protein